VEGMEICQMPGRSIGHSSYERPSSIFRIELLRADSWIRHFTFCIQRKRFTEVVIIRRSGKSSQEFAWTRSVVYCLAPSSSVLTLAGITFYIITIAFASWFCIPQPIKDPASFPCGLLCWVSTNGRFS
jgi:hypothetical protein